MRNNYLLEEEMINASIEEYFNRESRKKNKSSTYSNILHALVKFDNYGKTYCFKTILPLSSSDKVVCDTRVGLCTGTFVSYTTNKCILDKATHWILKKI